MRAHSKWMAVPSKCPKLTSSFQLHFWLSCFLCSGLAGWTNEQGLREFTVFDLPISPCPNGWRLREFAILFLGIPTSRDCESSWLDFANFSVSQLAETTRVCHLTLPISPCFNGLRLREFALWQLISWCPNEQRLREFAVWICRILGVQMSRDCESLPFDFANLWVLSGNRESLTFDFAYFSASQRADTARVHRLTLPISWCPNERRVQELVVWLCQFICVQMSRDCESSPFDFTNLSLMSGDCKSSSFDLDNFSESNWAETVRVRRLTSPIYRK